MSIPARTPAENLGRAFDQIEASAVHVFDDVPVVDDPVLPKIGRLRVNGPP